MVKLKIMIRQTMHLKCGEVATDEGKKKDEKKAKGEEEEDR